MKVVGATERAFLADCQARLAFDLIGISTKVLTEFRRRLKYNDLISRRACAEAPPRVEYGLTDLGRSLLAPIGAFGEWAFEHAHEVLAAQERAEAG